MALGYDPNAPYAIGVDIGGSKMNAGIIGEQGDIVHRCSLPTLAGETPVIDRLHQAIELLWEQAGERMPDRVRLRGIGIGTAGQVDWMRGSIRFASDLLPGYTGTLLRQKTEDRFRLPVRVDNDVNVLALTEKKLGAARGVRHFVCMTLGTGVGGAVVADGALLRGAWGGAGELGHMSVDVNGASCVCGGIGCLEQYASGTGIAKRMRRKLQGLGIKADARADAREAVSGWLAGEPVATAVMDEAFGALGAAIASLIHMLNPELVVIGGGVAEAGDPFFARIRDETAKRCMPSLLRGVQIIPAYQGNWSGMIGAGLLMWD